MKMKIFPQRLSDVKKLARDCRFVPVWTQLLSDSVTTVSILKNLLKYDYCFLLESVEGGERQGRYSFLGFKPFLTFQYNDGSVTLTRGRKKTSFETGDPLAELEKISKEYSSLRLPELPRFSGGGVGYISYDIIRTLEKLPGYKKDDLNLPDIFFCFYKSLLIFDHVNHTLKIVSHADVEEKPVKEAYQEAVREIESISRIIRRNSIIPMAGMLESGRRKKSVQSNFTRKKFEESVRKIKKYIRAGDIFQCVLSQRLSVRNQASPFDIYRTLRFINPSPYMFFLKFKDMHLIGSSPEVMVRVEDNQVQVRPIAGTRRRGKNEAEDRRLAQDLLSDHKELAEHTMLLDLGRNDVGRVCEYASVAIQEKMIVEYYSHVMHIVSMVTGKLNKNSSAVDALKVCFPAGTVSGAPKIRAMEIIDELEPTKRGPYAGAVGYLDFCGNLDTCITIRTMLIKGDRAYVQAGAGIVADSVPSREFEETMNKARALLSAIETAAETLGTQKK